MVKWLKTKPELVKWVCTQYSPMNLPPWIPDELKVYPEVVDEVPLEEGLEEGIEEGLDEALPEDEVPTQVVPTQVPTRRPPTTTRTTTRPPTTIDNAEEGRLLQPHTPTPPRGSQKKPSSGMPSTPPSPSQVSGQASGQVSGSPSTTSGGSGTKIPPVEVPPLMWWGTLRS